MLKSAFIADSPRMPNARFPGWLAHQRAQRRFRIEQIPFKELVDWGFEASTGNLTHVTGKFVKIEGIWVETNYGYKPVWSQPIINQSEIGILAFITTKFDGALHFLMQAKMEPGNIDTVQLAPTVQATRSNFTRVHQGASVPYIEYFAEHSRSVTLVDVLQSEQGARFLRKRNRNIIIEVFDDIPVRDEFCWLTLGQIQQLLRLDNVINMDARTVLSCIPYSDASFDHADPVALFARMCDNGPLPSGGRSCSLSSFQLQVLASALKSKRSQHSTEAIISWFTEVKCRYQLNVERIPLKYVPEWVRSDTTIEHAGGRFFSVIAVRVEAETREVAHWTQPLVKPREEGSVGFVVKSIDGVLHFLVQAKLECGNFDILEMAPTVQCLTGSYREVPQDLRPPFLDWILNAPRSLVRYRALQSEEGGRFFQEQNLNIIVEADDMFPDSIPDTYVRMTLNQMKEFIKYNNFVNVQARCLLSCLGVCP